MRLSLSTRVGAKACWCKAHVQSFVLVLPIAIAKCVVLIVIVHQLPDICHFFLVAILAQDFVGSMCLHKFEHFVSVPSCVFTSSVTNQLPWQQRLCNPGCLAHVQHPRGKEMR